MVIRRFAGGSDMQIELPAAVSYTKAIERLLTELDGLIIASDKLTVRQLDARSSTRLSRQRVGTAAGREL